MLLNGKCDIGISCLPIPVGSCGVLDEERMESICEGDGGALKVSPTEEESEVLSQKRRMEFWLHTGTLKKGG